MPGYGRDFLHPYNPALVKRRGVFRLSRFPWYSRLKSNGYAWVIIKKLPWLVFFSLFSLSSLLFSLFLFLPPPLPPFPFWRPAAARKLFWVRTPGWFTVTTQRSASPGFERKYVYLYYPAVTLATWHSRVLPGTGLRRVGSVSMFTSTTRHWAFTNTTRVSL